MLSAFEEPVQPLHQAEREEDDDTITVITESSRTCSTYVTPMPRTSSQYSLPLQRKRAASHTSTTQQIEDRVAILKERLAKAQEDQRQRQLLEEERELQRQIKEVEGS